MTHDEIAAKLRSLNHQCLCQEQGLTKLQADVDRLKGREEQNASFQAEVAARLRSCSDLLGELLDENRVRDSLAYWRGAVAEFAKKCEEECEGDDKEDDQNYEVVMRYKYQGEEKDAHTQEVQTQEYQQPDNYQQPETD